MTAGDLRWYANRASRMSPGETAVRVRDHVRRRAKIFPIVAALASALMANLHQESAGARELEDLRVLVSAAGDPHIVLIVDVNPVLQLWPFIAVARTAPGRDDASVLIELENRRSRLPERSRFVRLQRRGTMRDPDVIVTVHGDAHNCAYQPVVR